MRSTLASILALVFWSWKLSPHFGPHGMDHVWARSVMLTILIFLLPLLAWMYRQADRIFQHAVIRQNQTSPIFQTSFVRREKRILPQAIQKKIQRTYFSNFRPRENRIGRVD